MIKQPTIPPMQEVERNSPKNGESINRNAVNNAIEKSIELFPDAFACGLRLAQRIVADTPAEKPNVQCIAEIKIDRDDIEKLVAEKVEEIKASIEKRKPGKWIYLAVYDKNAQPIDHIAAQCPFCKFAYDTTAAKVIFDYCPKCGADLRGEQDG